MLLILKSNQWKFNRDTWNWLERPFFNAILPVNFKIEFFLMHIIVFLHVRSLPPWLVLGCGSQRQSCSQTWHLTGTFSHTVKGFLHWYSEKLKYDLVVLSYILRWMVMKWKTSSCKDKAWIIRVLAKDLAPIPPHPQVRVCLIFGLGYNKFTAEFNHSMIHYTHKDQRSCLISSQHVLNFNRIQDIYCIYSGLLYVPWLWFMYSI